MRHTPRVLITGASSGIGRAIARCYAERGRDLILVARSADKLEQVAEECRQQHRIQVDCLPADLSDSAQVDGLLTEIARRELTIDRLINNAGFGQQGTAGDIPLDRQLAMVDLNVRSLLLLTLALLPELRRQQGAICQVASTAAFQPGPWMATYYATKAFVLHFSEALAVEEAAHGLRVSALCPGPTRTGFAAEADMQDSPLFRHLAMSEEAVARAAVGGIEAGKTIIVPGLRNRLMIASTRFTPRWLVRRIVARLQRSRVQK